MTWLQPTMVALLLMTGMGVALLGSVKLVLAQRLQMDEARVGGLISLFGFVMGPIILLAGFMTDFIGPQVVMISGSLTYAVSLAILGWANTYRAALTAVLLFSAGWALQINVGNALTVDAFKAESASEASAFNLANVFFGVGAFVTPMAVAFLVRSRSLAFALLLLGGLALTPALLVVGVEFQPVPDNPQWGFGGLLTQPIVWLCAMALFFYGPLEASVGGWATSYLVEQGVQEDSAAGWLSSFWLMYMVSRLAAALTPISQIPPTLLVVILSVACIALLAAVVTCRNRQLAKALIPLAGLAFGPIFPTLIGVLIGNISDRSLHGRAIGLFFAIGGVGWTLIPMMIGAYAKRTSIRHGFRIALGAAVGLSVAALILQLRS